MMHYVNPRSAYNMVDLLVGRALDKRVNSDNITAFLVGLVERSEEQLERESRQRKEMEEALFQEGE